MTAKPRTHYAKSGTVSVAYQVFGAGAVDLVYVPAWVSHIEYTWEEPSYVEFLTGLGRFARVMMFDKRGTGLSDRHTGYPTLEERMDDIRAVMDAVGSDRAALLGNSEGGNMAALFAATYPSRVTSLILFGGFAKRVWAPDYPWAPTREQRQRWLDLIERDWGGVVDLADLVPTRAHDPAFAEWFATYLRLGASPGTALDLARTNTDIDVRHVLPAITAPTLVMSNRGDRDASPEESRYIATRIPNARFLELDGEDHLVWTSNHARILGEIEAFLTGKRSEPVIDRILTTILVTDIVGSTEIAAKLGDHRWSELLQQHNALIRDELSSFRGQEINTAGDSFLAAFDGPGRAVRCAQAIAAHVRPLGLSVRCGLHTGECQIEAGSLTGIALHIASRIAALAGPDEILASSTVRDLVVGSGLAFAERGLKALKGVPGQWNILAVEERSIYDTKRPRGSWDAPGVAGLDTKALK